MEGHSVVLYIHPLAKQCSGMQAAKVAAACGRRAGRPTAGQQLYMGLVVFCKLKYIIMWIPLFSIIMRPCLIKLYPVFWYSQFHIMLCLGHVWCVMRRIDRLSSFFFSTIYCLFGYYYLPYVRLDRSFWFSFSNEWEKGSSINIEAL
jgi:hypothetical protein